MSKILNLAKKIKALADRGEGGEKTNAENLLNKIMEEHGFTLDDIEGEKQEKVVFHVNYRDVAQKILFRQVVSTVLTENDSIDWHIGDESERTFKNGLIHDTVCVTASASEAVEIQAKFDFYKKLLDDELQIFISAFIHQNDIFPVDGPVLDHDTLSEEEKEKQRRIAMMSVFIDRGEYMPQLTTT